MLPPKALLSLSTHHSATLWVLSGSFPDQWKQNKAEMATLYISPFCLDLPPQPTWASILAATFPLKCRMEELGSLLAAGSMNPFSSLLHLPLLCSLPCRHPLAEGFLFPLLSGAVSLNYILHLFLVMVYKCVLNVTKPNFQYTKGKNEV